MGVIDGKTICQVALVVKDLEKTTEEYAKLFGVPKPEIFRVPEESVAHTQFKLSLIHISEPTRPY